MTGAKGIAVAIRELDVIRTTMPLEGPDVFDDARVYPLPVGSRGTVVYVYGNGAAFEVEFLVGHSDSFVSVQIPVESSQCELDWVAPEN
jgi:hypothetical protein